VKPLKAPVLHSLGSVRRKLFNELLRMAFEFFLATRGAEVVCLSFKIYPKFCCSLVKHSVAYIIPQSIAPVFFDEDTIIN